MLKQRLSSDKSKHLVYAACKQKGEYYVQAVKVYYLASTIKCITFSLLVVTQSEKIVPHLLKLF